MAGKNISYVPGFYASRRAGAAELADLYIREWDQRRLEKKPVTPKKWPTICFSRKIGVGALEIADILAQKIHYRVVDKEILEHIANEAKLTEKTVSLYDERYPGRLKELLSFIFGEKAFIKSDYSRHLFSAILAIAGLEPAIFVGRGTHLLLRREEVLAVRFICSKEYRITRLANILNITEPQAGSEIDRVDKEQAAFFKKVYGKKEASPYEFDMVINCDFINHPEWAADIVAGALDRKFGSKGPL